MDIRTFLIADIRGYTKYTQAHGDEAGARIAARFAAVVREEIESRGGQVVELRGDEALCAFGSPRSALRAAVALQQRCAEEMRRDPSLPLAIGIGIDAGEALAVEGGYRGGALNLAARLCSMAKRGEVLVSDGIVHLARRTDELVYVDRGRVSLKGFDEPVRFFQAQFPLDLPADIEEQRKPFWSPLRVAAAGVGGIVAVALLVGLATTRLESSSHPTRLGTNVVGILDGGGHIDGQVRLPGQPTALAAGVGALWAAIGNRDEVVRINPKARLVDDTIATGNHSAPAGIATGGGGIWVTDSGTSQVTWINARDPTTTKIISVGQGPGPIAFGEQAAWVINRTDGTLQRIDGERLTVSHPVSVGRSPGAIAVGGGWVWVTDTASGSVLRIDPKTRRVVGHVLVGNDPVAATFGGGRLWVANGADGTITRVDPRTNEVSPVRVGRSPTGVAYGNGAVWAAVGQPPTVTRIAPSLDVSATSLGSLPVAAVVSDGEVWVAALAPPASHHGGTLRVAYSSDDFTPGFAPFDPAVAPYPDHWQLLSMTNDGLTTYRKVGGVAGLQVVPDLAVAMPTIGDGGRTYTFQLRPSLHYSSGAPVRASDFRYTVERALSPAALSVNSHGYYQDVVFSSIQGYAACQSHPASCSLAQGIRTDDRTGTITIHLRHPDPALPLKLATTFGDFVPPGSPAPDSAKPVAATGPYRISKVFDRGHAGFLLTRNPHFRQWSADAQPAGYPDRIRWVHEPSPDAALTAVEHGDADIMIDPPPPTRTTELTTRYATLAHPYLGSTTDYLSLNTHVAPFTSLAVRRALNLAVDRRRIANVLGGPLAYTPTCQVLPPGMFGYAAYCPYTGGSTTAGVWTQPDLAAARELVRRSGMRGRPVVIWAWARSSDHGIVGYLVHVLDRLGLRASAHVTPPTPAGFGLWNTTTSNSGRAVSAVLSGWSADYPNPIDFLDLLLSCRSFVPHSNTNLNTSEFCDAHVDSLIQSAEAVQVGNPSRGAALWQQADRRAVDRAAWVPLVNSLGIDVIDDRVENYQRNPEWSVLLDQLWTR
jgi:ABC-type transport system substrate-binding protein/class 3 adenylate cyclase